MVSFAKEALTEPITMILIIIALFQLVLGAMGVMSLSEPVMIIVVLAIVTEIAVKTGLGIQKSAAELRAKRQLDIVMLSEMEAYRQLIKMIW